MYAIYGNIYHQYTPNVCIFLQIYIYIHMDPMGNILSYITIMCFGIWNLRLAFQKVKTNPDDCIVRHFTQPFMIDSQDKTKLTEVY